MATDAVGKNLVVGDDIVVRGGRITLKTMTDQTVAGSFAVEFAGGSLSGDFTARRCLSHERRLAEQQQKFVAVAKHVDKA